MLASGDANSNHHMVVPVIVDVDVFSTIHAIHPVDVVGGATDRVFLRRVQICTLDLTSTKRSEPFCEVEYCSHFSGFF